MDISSLEVFNGRTIRELGESFGAAGPSQQGGLFNWKELDEKLGATGH
jgi:hypothetical protein